MLLDFRGEIRSCGRLEVGRSSESSEPHEIPQQNIMLNWDFAEALFTATELDPKKTPNCGEHLLPTCINFESEGRFSTTRISHSNESPERPDLLTKGGIICQQIARSATHLAVQTRQKSGGKGMSRRATLWISRVSRKPEEALSKRSPFGESRAAAASMQLNSCC